MSVYKRNYFMHSSKGSTWSNHKYVKKVGDKYYYSDEQSSGTSSNSSKNGSNDKGFKINQMVDKVINGDFGNGAERKKLLGKSYAEIQKKVNERLLSKTKVTKSNVNKGKKQVKSQAKTSFKKIQSSLKVQS